MSDNIKIKENTNKIMVRGDRNNEFIRAYQNLSKDFREELDKVLKVTLFDGYSLAISEAVTPAESENKMLSETKFKGYDSSNKIIAFTDGNSVFAANADDWNGEYYFNVERTGLIGEWQEFKGIKAEDIKPVYTYINNEPEIIGYEFRQ